MKKRSIIFRLVKAAAFMVLTALIAAPLYAFFFRPVYVGPEISVAAATILAAIIVTVATTPVYEKLYGINASAKRQIIVALYALLQAGVCAFSMGSSPFDAALSSMATVVLIITLLLARTRVNAEDWSTDG